MKHRIKRCLIVLCLSFILTAMIFTTMTGLLQVAAFIVLNIAELLAYFEIWDAEESEAHHD